MYRCNVIDLRIADIKQFNSTAKSYIYADLLERPNELILYRDIKYGGLGLYHIQLRAKAALIATFLQSVCKPTFIRNHYHNALYRHYVLLAPMLASAKPPISQEISSLQIDKCTQNLVMWKLLHWSKSQSWKKREK